MTPPADYRYGRSSSAFDGEQVPIASYGSYGEAERAVDYLSDHRFPVERTAIVGRGLSSIESATGRFTFWRAAVRSAPSGLVPARCSVGCSECSTKWTR